MAVKSNSPIVAALREEVEKVLGRPLRGSSDYFLLVDDIQARLHENISDSTIKRLWNSKLSYDNVSTYTLDLLSQYVGFSHFEDFSAELASRDNAESELVAGLESVKAEDLQVGAVLSISWMPNRECILRYLGERKFEVVEAINSKIQPGDTFYCSTFIKGRGLYVDNLSHQGELYESYEAGTEHGLTCVKVLNL